MPEQTRVAPRFSLVTAGFAAIAILALALPALAQDNLSRGDKRWLEEVEPIMTPQERQAFESLPRGERNRFKEHFWARRSQNPHNPDAAEDAYNTWRKQADDQFGQRGQKGSRTDMALVMLPLRPAGQPRTSRRTGCRTGWRAAAGRRHRDQPYYRERRRSGRRGRRRRPGRRWNGRRPERRG